jgi:endonuclease-3 related protein
MDREVEIFRRLLAHYGPQGWWPGDSAFEVIVGAILMPQTAWRNVAAAIRALKAAGLLDVDALASAPLRTIRAHVKVAGLYRVKPLRLRTFCRHLLERCAGDLRRYFDRPTDIVRADLLDQVGVGPETADSILLYAGGHPVFLVDAYTIRIGQRIGLFETDDYDEVQEHFERRVRRDLGAYREYHALLVAHAKALCQPKPRCDLCPLLNLCAFGRRRGRGRRNSVK